MIKFYENALYRGRSIGRLSDILRHYYVAPSSDGLTFSGNSIYKDSNCKNKFADIFWVKDTDIPIFKFNDNCEDRSTRKYRYKIQRDKLPGVIEAYINSPWSPTIERFKKIILNIKFWEKINV